MPSSYSELLAHYRTKGLLVDTNLLLAYLVGSYDPRLLGRWKRVQSYTADDYDLLESLVSRFELIVTTPNILTEVSNLANSLTGDVKDAFFRFYAAVIPRLSERYDVSASVAAHSSFVRFGLTDAGIAATPAGRHLVLTDDLRLTAHLASLAVDVINFNNVRLEAWS